MPKVIDRKKILKGFCKMKAVYEEEIKDVLSKEYYGCAKTWQTRKEHIDMLIQQIERGDYDRVD